MKNIVALLAVATATASAFGAIAEYRTEVSFDQGLTWSVGGSVVATTAGENVRVLARVSLRAIREDSDPAPALDKILSNRFQPTVSNLVASDAHISGFNATGNITANFNNGLQPATDLGRDFGATTVAAVLAYETASTLHFAEAGNAAFPGTVGNNTALGVNASQNLVSTPTLNAYNYQRMFIYGIDLVAPSVANTSRTVNFDVPAAGVNGANGAAFPAVAFGYIEIIDEDGDGEDDDGQTPLRNVLAAPSSIASMVEISYVPAPGAAALLGLAGLVAGRRRR